MVEFLSDVVNIKKYLIQHVQDCIQAAIDFPQRAGIVMALMRGGEPMAFGFNEVFPLAAFIHVNSPDDIMLHHLQGRSTVVLVASVVDSGKTVVQFVQYVLNLYPTIRRVVTAGIAQARSISILDQAVPGETRLSPIALCLSETSSPAAATLAILYSTRCIFPDCMAYDIVG